MDLTTRLEEIIEEEQKRMIHYKTRYVLEERYARIISALLSPGEYVILGARQNFPFSLAPGIMIATNKRVLIIKRSFWSFYAGHEFTTPSLFVNIHYNKITEISLLNGMLFCTILLKVLGSSADVEFKTLRKKEATRMVGFLERIALANEE